MVYSPRTLDAVFGALADPTRRRLLSRLRARDHSISELAAPFRMTLPAVSKHLRVLERAGLVGRRREGRHWSCRINATPMKGAVSWLDEYRQLWEEQLDKLEVYLATGNQESAACPPSEPPPTPSGSSASSTRRRSGSSRRGPRRRP